MINWISVKDRTPETGTIIIYTISSDPHFFNTDIIPYEKEYDEKNIYFDYWAEYNPPI